MTNGAQRPALGWLRSFRKPASVGFAVTLVALSWALAFPGCTSASEAGMKGPRLVPHPSQPQEEHTSSVEIAFLRTIRFYQRWVSPVGGRDRCGFRPSCSAYGYAAIGEQGPLVGLMMTGDRLTRCNIWKKPGADYSLLPNGKLYDPVSKNLLCEP